MPWFKSNYIKTSKTFNKTDLKFFIEERQHCLTDFKGWNNKLPSYMDTLKLISGLWLWTQLLFVFLSTTFTTLCYHTNGMKNYWTTTDCTQQTTQLTLCLVIYIFSNIQYTTIPICLSLYHIKAYSDIWQKNLPLQKSVPELRR